MRKLGTIFFWKEGEVNYFICNNNNIQGTPLKRNIYIIFMIYLFNMLY